MNNKITTAFVAATLATAARATDSRLNIEDMRAMEVSPGIYEISGMARNASVKPIKNAFVRFNLYDAQGSLVGNTIAHASDLGPQEGWRFKASSPVPFSTFRVGGVEIYD